MSNMQLTPRLNRIEPNIVIDGGMEIWPEGTSRSVANNTSAYGAILFKCNNASSEITLTNSQQTSIPSGTNLQYSNQISKTAAGTLAAGTAVYNRYYIEGYDLNAILNNEFSVIFWVKSTVASNRSVAISNSGSTHSYVQQYNISATNTWQLKVARFDALNTCPGTLNRTNGIGLNVTFNAVAGSTFQTATLNQWQAGNFVSGIGEDTTWLTGTNHDFNIAGVMVLPGDWTSLEDYPSMYEFVRAGKNFSEELAMSQRYFEVVSATRWRSTVSSGSAEYQHTMNVWKRVPPTITSATGANISYVAESEQSVRVTATANAVNGSFNADARF